MIKIVLTIIVLLLLGGIIATGLDEFNFTGKDANYISSESEVFKKRTRRLSIKEIDSLSAEINLRFTEKNKLASLKKEG